MSLTYLVDEHSALPAPIAWKYLISNFPPSAAELFRLPPHRSGTHYQEQSFRHQHCSRFSTNWKLSHFNDPSFVSTVLVVSLILFWLIDWLIDDWSVLLYVTMIQHQHHLCVTSLLCPLRIGRQQSVWTGSLHIRPTDKLPVRVTLTLLTKFLLPQIARHSVTNFFYHRHNYRRNLLYISCK